MTGRRFFAWVWRVNSIVILAAGVVGLLVLLFAAVMIFKDLTRTRHATDVINVAEEEIDLAKASLGDFRLVEGTAVLRAPLFLEQEYEFASGSKETSSVQNYLYFDPATHEAYWLMPGNRGLIVEATDLPPDEFGDEEPQSVVAVVYLVVAKDTNGDGKLTRDDSSALAISDPVGKRFASLLPRVEELNGAHLVSAGKLLLLFTSEAALRAAEVDLATHTVLRESVLKPLKQEVQQQVPADAPG